MKPREIIVPVNVIVPEDATHYTGELHDEPTFYKCKNIGVVGEHWFYLEVPNNNDNLLGWDDDSPKELIEQGEWMFFGHREPNRLNLIPSD